MELMIIRHGAAQTGTEEEGGPSLSETGKLSIQSLLKFVREKELKPDALFSSPLNRAIQTTEILNQAWELKFKPVDWLSPGVEAFRILMELNKLEEQKIALVGHLPTLGWLLSVLIWGKPPKEVSIPKASLTLLKVKSWEPLGAKLLWMMNSDLLRSQ